MGEVWVNTFSKEKNGKKRKPSIRCRDAKKQGRSVAEFIYPCFFDGPEPTFAALFVLLCKMYIYKCLAILSCR